MRPQTGLTLFLVSVLTSPCLAQDATRSNIPPTEAQGATPAAPTSAETKPPSVVGVTPDSAQLNQEISLTVTNLDGWLGEQARLPHVVPFLDGRPLIGSSLLWVNRQKGEMRFLLLRDSTVKESRDAWARVLGGFGNGVLNGPRVMKVSVGKQDESPIESQVSLKLNIFPRPWAAIALVVLLGLLTIFLVLAVKSWILRGPGKDKDHPGPYSLSVCQMALWFFVVLSCFTSIWLMTGDLSVPASTLVLIGISSATGLGAKIIDKDAPPRASKDLLTDILSDNSGISLHRFQIFSWTIVLSIIFVSHAVNYVALPDFDTTLLTLMGISSGTYLGFKFPEKRD